MCAKLLYLFLVLHIVTIVVAVTTQTAFMLNVIVFVLLSVIMLIRKYDTVVISITLFFCQRSITKYDCFM